MSMTSIVVAAVATFASSAARAQWGVTIGLFAPQEHDLRTVWITGSGASNAETPAVKTLELRPLIIPRPDVFLRVGIQETCVQKYDIDHSYGDANSFEDTYSLEENAYLWTVPIDEVPVVYVDDRQEHRPPCRKKPVTCEAGRSPEISWVWPRYVSITMGESSECGMYGVADWTSGIMSLPAQKWVGLDAFFGKSAERLLARQMKREDLREPESEIERRSMLGSGWKIVREKRRWKAVLGAYPAVAFPPGLKLLPEFSHEGNLDDQTRIRLEYQVPGADDIHYAPDLHAPVATTATNVIAYAVGPDGVREVARVSKKKSETLVMVEWAYGDLVERWDKELHSIASRKFPAPEIRLRKE